MDKLIKLLIVGTLAVIPYTVSAEATSEEVAVRVRPGAEHKASPVRAHVRRDARRDQRQEEYTEEQYSEPVEEEYQAPTHRGAYDRGRPGGRR